MKLLLFLTAAVCVSAFCPGFGVNQTAKPGLSQDRRVHGKILAQRKVKIVARAENLSEFLKIYNERGAKQAERALIALQKKYLEMCNLVSDLNFSFRRKPGNADNSPSLSADVETLTDAVICWAQISKLEKIDPVDSSRLAKLLLEFNAKHPNSEFPPQWIELAKDYASRSGSDSR